MHWWTMDRRGALRGFRSRGFAGAFFIGTAAGRPKKTTTVVNLSMPSYGTSKPDISALIDVDLAWGAFGMKRTPAAIVWMVVLLALAASSMATRPAFAQEENSAAEGRRGRSLDRHSCNLPENPIGGRQPQLAGDEQGQ